MVLWQSFFVKIPLCFLLIDNYLYLCKILKTELNER